MANNPLEFNRLATVLKPATPIALFAKEKLISSMNNYYPDLHLFCKRVDEKDFIPNLLMIYQKRALFYRAIFFILSAVFFSMAGLILLATNTSHSHLFIALYGGLIKHILFGLSLIFSGVTAALGISLKVEIEALNELAYRAKKKARHLIAQAVKRNKHPPSYKDAHAEIHHKKEECRHLLERIRHAKELSRSEKGRLYEQALSAFQDHLTRYCLSI